MVSGKIELNKVQSDQTTNYIDISGESRVVGVLLVT